MLYRSEEYRKRVFEKEREAREISIEAKEKEEAYILKGLEDKEKLTQRMIRLELELKSKNKVISELENRAKEIEEIPPPTDPNANPNAREVRKRLIEAMELRYVKYQFRMVLIKYKMTLNEIKEQLFSDYKPDERITIKELTKVFQKKPLELSVIDAENLSRYLIENRNQEDIVYSKYREKLTAGIRIKLDTVLDINYPKD